MRSQTVIFSKLVRDCMAERPLAMPSGTSCAEVIRRMTDQKEASVIIQDGAGRLVGLLTEQDVVRRMVHRVSPDAPVDAVMTRSVLTIPESEYLYLAIGRMRQNHLRHLPVVNAERALVGVLNLDDALSAASAQMVQHIDSITHDDTVEGLKTAKLAQVELAEELLVDGLPAPEIQALLTHINADIYRRVVTVCCRNLEGEGWGEPPVDFVVIVMGSGGRGENYIHPDQDNGFILADYPDEEHNRIDGYFRELAERMVTYLDAVGLPLCKGYCMAVNPVWRKTLSQWCEQVTLWGRKNSTVAVQLADIFFDFQPVFGRRRELAQELRRHTVDMAKRNHRFLRAMYDVEADHRTALGLFGRFITERDKPEYKGHVNLKYNGTLSLVEPIRLLSLRDGVEATSTLARIDALHAGGTLDDGEREELRDSFIHITNMLLRAQIRDFRAGRPVSAYVRPDSLTPGEEDRLKYAFRSIEKLRKRVRMEFMANIF
ncbi:MAG: DUF294 nucleotidyltransferase-like domain-containing protein [Alphaproteobacteria bacterium]